MNSRKELRSILLASSAMILFLILISSAASAATIQSASPKITETRITTHGIAGCPAIYGDIIVWPCYPSSFSEDGDIYIYDLSKKMKPELLLMGQLVNIGILQFMATG
jgi:hypothetical protein